MQEQIICNKEDLVAIADAVRENIGSTKSYNVPELSVAAVEAIGSGSMNTVLYTEQTLTDAQKTQARGNIGAASAESVSQLSEKIESDEYQEAIVQQAIAAIGLAVPVVGEVDVDNNIILTGDLAEGTYTIKYENADGSIVVIGTLTTESESETPKYTNVLKTSVGTDGQPYNGGLGYKTGYKYSKSGGGDVVNAASCVTGYIYIPTSPATFYLYNVSMPETATNGDTCAVYMFDGGDLTTSTGSNSMASNIKQYNDGVWVDGNITQITFKGAGGRYFRLNTDYLGEDSIITCNEQIE